MDEKTSGGDNRATGVLTFLMLAAILAVFAGQTGGYEGLWQLTKDFFTGNPGSPKGWAIGVRIDDFGTFAAFVVTGIALCLACLPVISAFSNIKARNAIEEIFEKGIKFSALSWAVIIEEALARVIFLGLLASIFDTPIATYIFILVGNSLWALLHLKNYKESERQLVRVLPQFVNGILLSIVFLTYGVVAVCLVHFAFNAVLFAVLKKQSSHLYILGVLAYNVALALVFYFTWGLNGTIGDIVAWYGQGNVTALEGWTLSNYLALLIFSNAAFGAAGVVLMFDRISINIKTERDITFGKYVGSAIFGPVLTVLLVVFVYWLLGFFIGEPLTRMLIMSFIYIGIVPVTSGSQVAQLTWIEIPIMMITIPVIMSVGIGYGILLLIAAHIFELPAIHIHYTKLKITWRNMATKEFKEIVKRGSPLIADELAEWKEKYPKSASLILKTWCDTARQCGL